LTNTILKRKKPRKLDLTGVDAMLAFLTGIFGGDGGNLFLYNFQDNPKILISIFNMFNIKLQENNHLFIKPSG